MPKKSSHERSLLALFRSGVMSTPAINNYFPNQFDFSKRFVVQFVCGVKTENRL